MAALMRRVICKDEPMLVDTKEFFENEGEEFDLACLKPQKTTHLHRLIQANIAEYLIYMERKTEFEDELLELLYSYDIDFDSREVAYKNQLDEYEDPSEWKYSNYLSDVALEKVVPNITEEVFTVLFSDRELCQTMNESISEIISELSKSDNPTLLKEDGVIIRNTYWPKWVIQALVYRDKGRCAYCLKDITGVISTGSNYHIDHIVSLNQGGTNDPTNLQILCESCNLTKGTSLPNASRKQQLYWDKD